MKKGKQTKYYGTKRVQTDPQHSSSCISCQCCIKEITQFFVLLGH